MKKYLCLSIAIMALVGVVSLGTATTAFAAKGVIKNTSGGGSAGSITVSDLGITDVGTLPSSKWYFFKEWGRGFERFFTFNSIKKAELELRIANEKAAEALTVQETKPDDAEALMTALKNYTSSEERFQSGFIKIRDADSSPDDFEKLLEKLSEQTLQHAVLFNQLAERWSPEQYVEDANVVNPKGARDNHLQGAVDVIQAKIQEIVVMAAEKDKNIEQKATDQIARADVVIHELESGLAKLQSGFIYSSQPESAGFAINEPGVPIERQTPKRDFGDRMKVDNLGNRGADVEEVFVGDFTGDGKTDVAIHDRQTGDWFIGRSTGSSFTIEAWAGSDTAGGMLTNARAHLTLAKPAFAEGKFGEAFGQARAAEVLARNGLRIINNDVEKLIREGVDADAPRIENLNSAMPIVPGTGKTGEKIVPETEKRVFPETNNRVFPETNNRTACDDRQAPGCLRGEILECHNGTWVCIGPATGGGQILNPTESPSTR